MTETERFIIKSLLALAKCTKPLTPAVADIIEEGEKLLKELKESEQKCITELYFISFLFFQQLGLNGEIESEQKYVGLGLLLDFVSKESEKK